MTTFLPNLISQHTLKLLLLEW